MGYRSDVRVHVYPIQNEVEDKSDVHSADEYARLKLLMATTFKDVWEMWEGCFSWHDNHNTLDFVCTDIKWYEGYQTIDTFMAFLDDVDECKFEYEFMRVGEDIGDVEYKSSDDAIHLLDVNRQIVSALD